MRVVAREMLYGRQVEQAPSIGDYLARQTQVDTMFSRVNADFGITIVRPGEALCASGQCRVIDDGRALYYDTSHLSLYGNTVLAKLLAGAFGSRP